MHPCESCHAGCCRSFAVPLSGADILRIERGLNLSFWEFACRWADPDGSIAASYAPQFYFEDEPQTPFVIALMHSNSRWFPGTTRCRFLNEGQPDSEHPLGQARCGIYTSRPAACRVFPTRFNATGELVEIHNIPEPSRNSEMMGPDGIYDLCPREWETSDVDPVQPLHDLLIARHEMQFFHQIAAMWNRAPHPWELFPDFIHAVYERRVVREPERQADVEAASGPQMLPFPGTAPQTDTARRAA